MSRRSRWRVGRGTMQVGHTLEQTPDTEGLLRITSAGVGNTRLTRMRAERGRRWLLATVGCIEVAGGWTWWERIERGGKATSVVQEGSGGEI